MVYNAAPENKPRATAQVWTSIHPGERVFASEIVDNKNRKLKLSTRCEDGKVHEVWEWWRRLVFITGNTSRDIDAGVKSFTGFATMREYPGKRLGLVLVPKGKSMPGLLSNNNVVRHGLVVRCDNLNTFDGIMVNSPNLRDVEFTDFVDPIWGADNFSKGCTGLTWLTLDGLVPAWFDFRLDLSDLRFPAHDWVRILGKLGDGKSEYVELGPDLGQWQMSTVVLPEEAKRLPGVQAAIEKLQGRSWDVW